MGSVFLIGVPVMVLLLVLGPVLLPEYRDPEAGRLDLLSAAQPLAAVLAVIYGLKRIAEDGLGWLPAACILAGVAIGAAFLRRQRTLATLLIDLALFRASAFSAALVINTCCFFGCFGAFLFIAQYLQMVMGLSPLQAGLWSVPSALGFVVGSMLAPMIVRHIHPGLAVMAGLLLALVGFCVLTQVGGASGLAILVTGSVIFALGLAPVVTLGTDLIVGSAPPERAGSAAAISETSSEFGGALGIAVLGSIVRAVYRHAMEGAVLSGVPDAAAQAARSTLGGAVAVVANMPAASGAALLDASRGAFAQAFQVTATVSAAWCWPPPSWRRWCCGRRAPMRRFRPFAAMNRVHASEPHFGKTDGPSSLTRKTRVVAVVAAALHVTRIQPAKVGVRCRVKGRVGVESAHGKTGAIQRGRELRQGRQASTSGRRGGRIESTA